MSNEPLVCAVMLTRDRPAMAKRAVECFRSQRYKGKMLLVLDTSSSYSGDVAGEAYALFHRPDLVGKTIGDLRNFINQRAVDISRKPACPSADILIHWDDDDWSHPNRISEQVALLQASGKQCIGYRDMLFWDSRARFGGKVAYADEPLIEGEAWLYSNADPRYIVGSSLCYWRETWEKRPFRAAPENPEARGEDVWFIMDRDTLGVSSIFFEGKQKHSDDCVCGTCGPGHRTVLYGGTCEPRMICSIHGRNTTSYAGIEKSGNWTRVPEFDEVCRRTMSL